MPAPKLIRPSPDYKDSFLEALAEFHAEGRYLHNTVADLRADFAGFVAALRAERGHPHQPFQQWVEQVPETVTWLVKDNTYLGTVEIRHRLNWHLSRWGGHIHFVVRPSMRGRGFGKTILLKAIPIANYLGIDKALLTIAPANAVAARVIESCGGALEEELPAADDFPTQALYWLDCT